MSVLHSKQIKTGSAVWTCCSCKDEVVQEEFDTESYTPFKVFKGINSKYHSIRNKYTI